MPHKTILTIVLLLITTVVGISVALRGQERWMEVVFWYSSQLLPVLYVVLAWWGSQREDDPVESSLMATLPPSSETQPSDHV
jgi:cell division protein FtsW (lipid II flippase)